MKFCRTLLAFPLVAVLAMGPGFGSSKEEFFLEEGTNLHKAHKYEEAIAQFDQLLEIDPTNWTANFLTAASYLALYHPGSEEIKDREYAEKALSAFERTLKLAPPSPEEREEAEQLYLSFLDATGDLDKALGYLERQLVTRPNDLALIKQIANVYRQRDPSKAIEYFEKLTDLTSTNKESWYTLGVNCWARSYHGVPPLSQEEREQVVDKGITALEKALALDPDYFEALAYINLMYREKAKALTAVGKYAEANEAYAQAENYQNRAIDIRKSQMPKANAR